MSTKTDFYLGRGETAEWLGSLQCNCDLQNLLAVPAGRLALTATDETTYRPAVTELFAMWDNTRLGVAFPRDRGWPWPWPTSHRNDLIITLDPEPAAVFITVGGGVTWHQINPCDPRPPNGDDPLGPPDLGAWLRDPAAPPSVPLPLMRDPATGGPTTASGA